MKKITSAILITTFGISAFTGGMALSSDLCNKEYSQQINEKQTKLDAITKELNDLGKKIAEKEAEIVINNDEITKLKQDKQNLETSNLEKDNKIKELQNQLENADNLNQDEVNELNSQIESLQAEKSQLQQDIEELNTKISTLESNVSEKQAKLDELQTEYDKLKADFDKLQIDYDELEILLANYQAEIDRLNGLVDNYESILTDVSQVNYYIKDTVAYTLAVSNGTSVEDEPVPADTNEYRFDGWSLDRKTIIDTTEKVISAPTNFYAVLTTKHEIQYNVGNEIQTEYVAENCFVDVFTAPTKTDYEFECWLDEEGNVVDTATTYATKDMALTAKYKFVIDEEAIQEAILTKVKADGTTTKSCDTVDIKYLSFTENLLFASCYKSGTVEDKYLVKIELNNTTSDVFITNDGLATLISEGVLTEGQLMSSLFADSQFTSALERYINEHPTKGTAYVFDTAWKDAEMSYPENMIYISPTIVTVGEDGTVTIEKAPYQTLIQADNAFSTIKMLALAILNDYGYYDQEGIYTLMPNSVEKTTYSNNELV